MRHLRGMRGDRRWGPCARVRGSGVRGGGAMSFRGLSTLIGLAVATSGALVLALPVVASAEPVPASGSLVITHAVFNYSRTAVGHTIVPVSLTGYVAGNIWRTFNH